jgi:hypothetical protein
VEFHNDGIVSLRVSELHEHAKRVVHAGKPWRIDLLENPDDTPFAVTGLKNGIGDEKGLNDRGRLHGSSPGMVHHSSIVVGRKALQGYFIWGRNAGGGLF